MPGRHRHAVDVRTDGLAAVLGRLLDHPAVRSAALVDVDSGMLLDAATGSAAAGPRTDPDVLGALHADLVRAAAGLLPPPGAAAGPDGDVVVDGGATGHHVVRVLVDPHGGRLALTAVVVGPWWVVERVRRRLRRVPADALTAGPPRVPQPHAVGSGQRPVRAEVVSAARPPDPTAPPAPPPWTPPATAVRRAAVPSPVAPSPAPPADRSSPTGPLPTGPLPTGPLPTGLRPAPAAVPAGPAMALLARTGGRPAPPPAAALEAPAPVVRRLRPVGPPATRPPGAPAPPSALPPAPHAGGSGRER